jgi:hypothetical protein
MQKEQLCTFLQSGESANSPDFHLLKELTLKYPYFQGILFYYLKCLYIHNEVSFSEELRRLSPQISDRKALFYFVFSGEYAQFFQKTGKSEIARDRTGFLLDAFFDTSDHSFGQNEEWTENVLGTGIVSVDYFSYLTKMRGELDESDPALPQPTNQLELRHQNIIDSFLQKSENGDSLKIRLTDTDAPLASPLDDQAQDDGLEDSMFFTETLSRIYIKQKKYEKAYEIIRQLSLNYPEKNTYFADQIRFLEKLIVNSKNNK